MVWLDTALAGVSILSTVIATLRAGSRGIYLINHNAIGIMDGPRIQRPVGNETNMLFELSEAFRHSVRLSFATQYYENVTVCRTVSKVEEEEKEAYTLYPKPYIEQNNNVCKDNQEVNSLQDEDEWDHNLSTKAALRFKTNDGTARIAELSVFSPNSFAHLRSVFGITEESYRESIFKSGSFVSFQSNSKGAARVGGVFFFTPDGAYMIKTIKKEEAKTFLKMLPKYHSHMRRHGRTSLLTRFCGMYGVRIHDEGSSDDGQLHTFVVMNSVFPAEASTFVTERFDLKGSTVGREVSEEELTSKGTNAVLKDLDLAREVALIRSMEGTTRDSTAQHGFQLGVNAKAALLSQLREDVKLLVDCKVMDYSLLVGVVDMSGSDKNDKRVQQALLTMRAQEKQFERLEEHSTKRKKSLDKKALIAMIAPFRLLMAPPIFVAKQTWSFARLTLSSIITLPLPYYGSGDCGVDGGLLSIMQGKRRGDRAMYYMGLIDFLQPWTARKVVEKNLKGLMGYDTKAISCVDPEEYANRFLEFLDANIS